MNIHETIEQYSYYLDDLDYIDALLKSTDLDHLYDLIAEMLQSGNREQIWNTNLFLRDVMKIYVSKPLLKSAQLFREGFYTSVVVDALHKNLFATVFNVRRDTVHTIGRVGLISSIPILKECFTHSLENDPLIFRTLVGELGLLGNNNQWDLIDDMAHSAYPMTRWAVLSTYMFASFHVPEDDQETEFLRSNMDCLDLLQQDNYSLIQQEAEYKARQCRFALTADTMDKAERKRVQKALELEVPPLTFDTVEIRFGNYMVETQKEDYSVAELEAFVLTL